MVGGATSPRLLTSKIIATRASLLQQREYYCPYGERNIRDPKAAKDTRWFTGKSQDAESKLSYFGARYYDPLLGRFMGIDPVGVDENNVHSHNRYAYANNNPYKFVDPDGRASTLALCFGGPAACAVGIVTAGATAIYVNNVLQHAIQQNRTDKGEDISSALTGTSATASPGGMLPEGDDQNGNNSSDRSNVRFQKDKGAGQGDISADISKRDFMKNLENDGFKKSISKDGTATNFTRGNTRYSVRDFSKSGDGGPAAEKYINDKIITKIRLGK